MKKAMSLLLALMFALSLVTFTAAETNEFAGTVTGYGLGSITVVNANGNVVSFFITDQEAEIPDLGAVISVAYEGDFNTGFTATAITLIAEPTHTVISGTVTAAGPLSFTLSCGNSVVHDIQISADTAITGKATVISVGDTADVTYTAINVLDTVTNFASAVNITALAKEKKTEKAEKEKEENLINKKLSGVVYKLTEKRITIRTSKGKEWTFILNSRTGYPGKFDLDIGSTVTITYDGYASDHPAAKKVKTTKEADYRLVTYTKSGKCSFFEGMAIGIGNDFSADVAYAKHSGKGKHEPGTKVTVTYYTNPENGRNYATKIKWK